MVDLLDIATREFIYNRPENAIQILSKGLGWNFNRCWQTKQRYERWIQIQAKTEKMGK